jgi:hypothetical protein
MGWEALDQWGREVARIEPLAGGGAIFAENAGTRIEIPARLGQRSGMTPPDRR